LGPISPGTDELAVVVLDALAAPHDRGLDAFLGAARARRLRAVLLERALRWGHSVATAVHHAAESEDVPRLLAGHRGPVLLIAPDVPGLDGALAAAVADDLAAGCDVVVGAAHDARPYLVGLSSPTPEGLALADGVLAGGVLGAVSRAREAAGGAPGSGLFGMVRSERRLSSPADARALALDPLTPPDLAALLR
jgi:hypothetical protein